MNQLSLNTPEQIALFETLKAAAKDMGISARELAAMINSERAMIEENKRSRAIDQNNEKQVSRNSDRVAEKFGTFKSDSATREIVRNWRDDMRRNKSAIAARKIARAIPATSNAIVTTKVDSEIVTISRVEKAPNVKALEKKYRVAYSRELAAVAKLQSITEAAEKRTHLGELEDGYLPKADRIAIANAARRVSKAHNKVSTARVQLNIARERKSAMGLTAIPAGTVRLSLRPQSMANRVAMITREIPARNDVNPIREFPNVQRVATSSIDSPNWRPEDAYLLYELESERERERERVREIARERALKAAAEYDAMIAAELAEAKAARDSEYRERRKMAARERRRNAKLKNRR